MADGVLYLEGDRVIDERLKDVDLSMKADLEEVIHRKAGLFFGNTYITCGTDKPIDGVETELSYNISGVSELQSVKSTWNGSTDTTEFNLPEPYGKLTFAYSQSNNRISLVETKPSDITLSILSYVYKIERKLKLDQLPDKVMSGAGETYDGKSGFVPQPIQGDQDKFLKGDGTWGTPTADVQEMTGATSSKAGTSGAVPAPSKGSQNKALAGSGTFKGLDELELTTPTPYTEVLTVNGRTIKPLNRVTLPLRLNTGVRSYRNVLSANQINSDYAQSLNIYRGDVSEQDPYARIVRMPFGLFIGDDDVIDDIINAEQVYEHMYSGIHTMMGTVDGVLVADVQDIKLSSNAIYLLTYISHLKSTGAFRGMASYTISTGLDPTKPYRNDVGFDTTAKCAVRYSSHWGSGTTGIVLQRRTYQKSTTPGLYYPALGIGSCTTNCFVKWSMLRLL